MTSPLALEQAVLILQVVPAAVSVGLCEARHLPLSPPHNHFMYVVVLH